MSGYSRVYHSIVDDPKFADVYDDPRRLGTWLQLLIVADQAYPASGYIPAGTHRASVVALAEAGIVDLGTGSRFRIHGLDAERARRSSAARVGGLASGRSRAVEQSMNERSTEANLDETRLDETSITPPPASRGHRKNGTNPRALGTNPRAMGTSPRQEREAQKRGPTRLHAVLTAIQKGPDRAALDAATPDTGSGS